MTESITDPLVILGIDPGLTTGIAVYTPINPAPWGTYQLPPAETADFIQSFLTHHQGNPKVQVVMEGFKNSRRVLSFQPDALELLGYGRHLCRQNNVPFFVQYPSDAQKIITNDVLKEVNAYRPSRGLPHAREATRHIVYHLHREYSQILRAMKETSA